MPNLTSRTLYPASPTNVTISASQTLAAIVVHGSNNTGGAITLNSATLDGSAMTILGNSSSTIAPQAVCFIASPTSGSVVFSPTFSATPASGFSLEVFEFTDASALSNFASALYSASTSPATKTYTFTSLSGEFAILAGCSRDDNSVNVNPGMPDAGFTAGYTDNDGQRQVVSGYISSLASASEAFDLTFSDSGAGGGNIDGFSLVAFTVDAAASTLTADSITGGTIRAGDTVTIQLSNATNAAGKTLSIPQGAITPTAQDINSISFLAPDLKTFGDKTGDYSTNITITVTDDAESDTIVFQISPDVGDEAGAITAVEGIYVETEFAGVAVTDLYYTTTISGADFTVGAVPVLETERVFNLWIQDQTDGVWGAPFTVTIPGSATPSTTNQIILHDVLKPVLSNVLRNIFED